MTAEDISPPPSLSRGAGITRPTVVLIGFMGAGKSTVGRIIADRLGVDFIDTDAEIVARTGESIPDIFASRGAQAFRELESEVVLDLLAAHRGVVALGGGAVTTESIRVALDGHRVVHLRIGAEDGFSRVSGSDRPLLAGENPAQRYRELLDERADIYVDVATIDVDAAVGKADDVADVVITEIARELAHARELAAEQAAAPHSDHPAPHGKSQSERNP